MTNMLVSDVVFTMRWPNTFYNWRTIL